MATPEEPDAKHPDAPPMLGLPDDLLAVIFLRLPTLEDVGRAATACPTFRRVIAERSFRRRLRSIHPAPFLGFLYGKFYPAKAPHPSAPYARALARAADFSFSFIPAGGPWLLRDVRDGRVLLESSSASREFAVADPVSRRYALLPLMPLPQQRRLHLEPILVPASEEDDETSFRVICVAVCRSHLVAFVISSANGRWLAFRFQDWSASVAKVSAETLWFRLHWRYFADGCFYWRVSWTNNKLLVLDTRRREFSFADILLADTTPVHRVEYCTAIAEAGDGRVEIFTLRMDFGRESESLYSIRRSDAGSASAWQSMKEVQVQLPSCHFFFISGAAGRYLLLQGTDRWRGLNWRPLLSTQYFLLELDTLRIEKICELSLNFQHLNLYTGFPPSLSLPSL